MRRVLLIEDEQEYAKLVIRRLAPHVNFLWADNLHTGVQMFHEHQPDVVLLDLGLPDSAQGDTIHTFKGSCPDSAVVVISGNGERAFIEETILGNASGYMVKGVDDLSDTRILKEIEKAIELHGELKVVRRAHERIAES